MPGAYKRKAEKARGKLGRYTCWWTGPDGKVKTCPGLTDRAGSLDIANAREKESRMVREGLVDPTERARREASFRPVADHIGDYRLEILAKQGTAKHAREAAGVLTKLLADSSIESVGDLAPDRIQQALGRLGVARSARTVNKALGFIKAFAAWLERSNRLKEVPRGLLAIEPRNVELDRKRVRRALTPEEFELLWQTVRLKGATIETRRVPRNQGPKPIGWLTGPDRAILYALAAGTGFRRRELGSLTPESFDLDGDDPSVTVRAGYSKRGRNDRQPIRRALAAELREYLAGRPRGVPVFAVPQRTARMLARDLELAGICPKTIEGVADFHALRAAYVTGLVRSGVDAATAQKLARHSDVRLTLQTYTSTTKADLRKALEGE